MLKRFRATVIVTATLIPAIAGCNFINSINPFGGGGQEVPADPNAAAPADPNAAAPADPNAAAPADPNAAASPADPNAAASPADPNAAASPADPNAAAPQAAPPVNSQTPFRDGVNAAMGAAEAVQTAQAPAEWQAVVQQWQQAIALMQAVPQGDPNYQTAQQKVQEYQNYLNYAQQNATQ